jgi:hypothetical protein
MGAESTPAVLGFHKAKLVSNQARLQHLQALVCASSSALQQGLLQHISQHMAADAPFTPFFTMPIANDT